MMLSKGRWPVWKHNLGCLHCHYMRQVFYDWVDNTEAGRKWEARFYQGMRL